MPHSALKSFFIGFISPCSSIRFLFQKKYLFFIGITPHIINFLLYICFINKFIIGKLLYPFINSLQIKATNTFILYMLQPKLFEIFVWILAVFLYGFLGTSFVNTVASPIYDHIAKKSYESVSRGHLPIQTLSSFLDSLLSEITKTVIIFSVFIILFFIHIFFPLVFIVGLWYLGWNSIDRTLFLLNLPIKERLKFGIQNAGMCIGLGLWSYLPIIGPLFAFTTASAGAILVAKSNIAYLNDNSPGADF